MSFRIFKVEDFHRETNLQISVSNFQAVHNIWSPSEVCQFQGTGHSSKRESLGVGGGKERVWQVVHHSCSKEIATTDPNCNAVFNFWAFSFKRDVDKLGDDMGTIKTGNVIEGWLEKYILKEFKLGNRYNCLQLLKELWWSKDPGWK